MPTSYTSLIGLALPVTGELAGVWGDTVNNYITQYLDSAVAGTQTISGTQTAVTLSVTNGSSLVTAGSGSTGSAQFQIINCTGNPAGLLTITAPASSRQYIIINATSTSQSVKIVGAGPTTGVTLISGEKAHVAWNGSDFVKIATTAAAGGSNTQVQYNSSGVLAGSSNMTFDGTNLTVGGTASATKLIPTGGAATGNGMYLPAANTLAWSNNGSETMRLDSSGNLGLGGTPSAWASNWKAFQIEYRSLAETGAGAGDWTMAFNAVFDSTDSRWEYQYTGDNAVRYSQTGGGVHSWHTAASGTAGNTITFTQAMTLDASGYLLVGGTSTAGVGASRLQVGSTSSATSQILIQGSSTHLGLYAAAAAEFYLSYATGSALIFGNGPANGSTFTERARITSGGYFKASNDGTYVDSTGTYHELKQTASSNVVKLSATNASYASDTIEHRVTRSASTAYSFFYALSGGTADLEFYLRGDGNAYADGTWNNNGADYAEYFESATGDALTVGASVVLDGNKVREATTADPVSAIMGVVRPKEPSKASMVIGNTAWNKWANKYLTDDFDRYIMEDHDVVEWTDEDGTRHSYESHNIPTGVTVPEDAVVKTHDDKGKKFQHYKLNPAWNPDAEYVNRENRPEWNIIGLVGQVKLLKGKPVNDRWIKMRDVSATVEEWMIR
jgi:hypothetical protein